MPLPPGFTLDTPAAPTKSRLPPRFTLDPPATSKAPLGALGAQPAAAQDPGPGGGLSIWQRILHGIADPFVGGGQLLTHVPGSIWSLGRPYVDAAVREREADYQKARGSKAGFDWPRLAGNVLSPLNYAMPELGAGGGLVARLGGAALQGATAGAMQPVAGAQHDFWTQKAKDIAAGTVGGTAGGGVAAAAGRAIAPIARAAQGPVQTLARKGVGMTLGQIGRGAGGMVGKIVSTAEDALKSFPILGSFIRGAQGRSIADFNHAVVNQTLAPIGKTLPAGVKAGNDAVKQAAEMIGDAYGHILSRKGLRFSVDPKFQQDILGLYRSARGQPGQMDAELQKVFRSNIFERLKLRPGSPPSMDAAAFKMAESRLNMLATRYMKSPDVDQQLFGEHIKEAVYAMRSALERQNPAAAKDLANVNAAYAMLVRVEKAAGAAKEDGVFTPNQLLSAVRATDLSRRSRAFAHGDALMQVFAQAGQRVLPGKMPDSGTPERAAWNLLLGGEGVAAASGHPGVLAATLGTAAALAPPYTRVGGKIMQKYLMAGGRRMAVGEAIQKSSRVLSPAVAAAAADSEMQNSLAALNAVLGAAEPSPEPRRPRIGDTGPQGGTITGIGPRAQ